MCTGVLRFLFYLIPFECFREVFGGGRYVLDWMADIEHQRVIFNVTAQTNGYVGFGLSRSGKMSGADIVIGGVANGKSYFSVSHRKR